jgi:hypothetical protein
MTKKINKKKSKKNVKKEINKINLLTQNSKNLLNQKLDNKTSIEIPIIYNSLYNKLKNSLYKTKPVNKNIKFKINQLEEDFNDSFFPYKLYIDLFCKNDHIQFEIFLSNIICNYTIRPILFEYNNTIVKKDLIKDDFSNIKGYNDKNSLINEMLNLYNIMNLSEECVDKELFSRALV